MATKEPQNKRVQDYSSLLVLGDVDEDAGTVDIEPAQWLL